MTGKLTDTEPPIPRKSKQVIGKPLKSVTAKMLKDALKTAIKAFDKDMAKYTKCND